MSDFYSTTLALAVVGLICNQYAVTTAAPTSIAPDTDPLPSHAATTPMSWETASTAAASLVSSLSLQEKLTLVTGVGWGNGPCVGNIAAVDSIQFPGLCLQDSPTGVRGVDGVSAFPASINVAATFDKDLMYQHGVAMGREERGKGVSVTLGPVVNFMRAPAGGRNWEGQGADPYLTSVSASQQIRGIQSQGVIATVKHFILNDQEHGRDFASSEVDMRALHEIYLRPFKACVDAGVGAVMCSYNRVNGTYACENEKTLSILKNDLNFKGFVMTDWWAAHSTDQTALAGTDMMMPGGKTASDPTSYFGPALQDSIQSNRVPISRLNDMTTRILSSYLKIHSSVPNPPPTQPNFNFFHPEQGQHIDVQEGHGDFIRKVGAASTVLVKALGDVLPLRAGEGMMRLAVLGEDARGPTKGTPPTGDHGEVDGTIAQGWGSGTTNFPYLVAPIDGIKNAAAEVGMSVTSHFNNYDSYSAAQIAKNSDIAIVFVGANSGEDYITVEGNEGDRNDLNVWHNGNALIESVAQVQKTIVVIHSPGAVNMPWIHHPNIVGVFYALMPGQESGNAIADILFGKVNPSGRLPFTVASDRSQYPADVTYNLPNAPGKSYPVIEYKESLLFDYTWFTAKNVAPVFWFGHGLSYTTFEYRDLQIDAGAADSVTVSVNIRNAGSRDGHEVVQLYLEFPDAYDFTGNTGIGISGDSNELRSACDEKSTQGDGRLKVKRLRGFERVFLKKGETTRVDFTIAGVDGMGVFDAGSGKWALARGAFCACVGASAGDVRLTGVFVR